jgi:antagonist of KipI|tara:strand:+ start:697 stop:1623 length:927 start_codon:yes stop_codon:yes gene_type:complete
MSLIVLKPGLQSTIQDLGRYNYSHFGISASGAADPLSLKIGNLIVGNKESASAIEMTIIGGEFQFDSECYIAISGSEFEASLDNNYITNQKAIDVKKGQILSFGQAKTGARAYLCIQGGIDVDNYLSSKSTHILSGIGGYLGQPISKGDVLSFGINKNSIKPIIFRQLLDMNTSKIRVISGLQNDFFDDKAWSSFISNPFTVSNSSNRMGIRLDGNKILSNIESEIITEGVPLGAIQVPGSGDPIISFVEHQTTGGYPKIANVIIADIHKVGQLKPGDKFQFNLVSKEEAEELRLEQMSFIKNLKNND